MPAAGFLGLDPEEVERLASRMESEAQKMDETIRQVTSQLKGTLWVGPDRNRFEEEWNNEHQVSIRRTVDLLRKNAQELKRHAKEQRSTSGR